MLDHAVTQMKLYIYADSFSLLTFAIGSIADFKEGPKDAFDTNF